MPSFSSEAAQTSACPRSGGGAGWRPWSLWSLARLMAMSGQFRIQSSCDPAPPSDSDVMMCDAGHSMGEDP